MKLVWSDEFDYTGPPNPAFWTHQLKGGTAIRNKGWGNNEVQWYTDSPKNSFVKDGVLTIRALKDDSNGHNTTWTSARLSTSGKAFIKYGYIEASMKLSPVFGSWPAFWMMPQNSVYGPWPQSGEIDIMEYGPSVTGEHFVYSTLHYGKDMSDHIFTEVANATIPTIASEFHRYGLRWDEKSIQFVYDGKDVGTAYLKRDRDTTRWPFDQECYAILNLAMGGNLGGEIDPKVESAEIEIDYVRMYEL